MSNILDNSLPDPDGDALLLTEIIVDEDVACPVSPARLQQAATLAAASRGFDRGEICVRVTNDSRIHEINRDHLGHDYPTDVISFSYRAMLPSIEGELVVSVDTARQRAAELGWSLHNELMLYVVHGTLHIAGMDDIDHLDRTAMRQYERKVMKELGIDEIERFAADIDPTMIDSTAQEGSE
ncbi:MAG: rRNA maturation RNase YbeY [Rubripirellula sp.]